MSLAFLCRKGQEFHDLGHTGDGRHEARVDHVDFFDLAGLKRTDERAHDLLRVRRLRTLADADTLTDDVKAAILEEVASLAPDGDVCVLDLPRRASSPF